MKRVRIAYCLRSAAHFSYHLSTLDALVDRGVVVQLVLDEAWSKNRTSAHIEEWTRRRGQPRFKWMQVRSGFFQRDLIFGLRELRSYASYLSRKGQSTYYLDRWLGYVPKPARRAISVPVFGRIIKFFIKSGFAQRAFDLIERLTPVPGNIVQFLVDIEIDVLVASPTNLRFANETDYIKAAKSLGIPTVLPVLSWDNLTTKGLIHVHPDRILAWNFAHAAEARTIHGIEEKRIAVTGAPFFDKWLSRRSSIGVDRESFCRKVGLDPDRPFLLYLRSSNGVAPNESLVIEKLVSEIAAHPAKNVRELQILVRPHPANVDCLQSLIPKGRLNVWPRIEATQVKSVPETQEELEDFQASVVYSVAVVGLNTSGMIDALVLGKPVISLLAESYRRTQIESQHYRHLLAQNAVIVAETIPEVVEKLSNIEAIWSDKKLAVAAFVGDFIWPKGISRSAGSAQADEILSMIK